LWSHQQRGESGEKEKVRTTIERMSKRSSGPKVDYFLAADSLRDHYNSIIRQQKYKIFYSDKYPDDTGYEYRHVKLPSDYKDMIPVHRLMVESEWRQLGVSMSPGWEQYMIHGPEPHVLLFRRQLPDSMPAADAAVRQELPLPLN
jgi:cyclin-dependent kinase regulatory subunit CKS1